MDRERRSAVSATNIALLLFSVLVLCGLYLTSRYNYLLFHSLAEIFSIVVACGIFIVFWNSRRFLENGYYLFVGIAYLFIGCLDLIHTLGYTGMSVFPGYDTNLPAQLWIASRYLESLSLLAAPFFLRRRLKPGLVFIGYTVVSFLLLGSIFYWNVFPDCFVEGVGLTPFKKISEYIISLILVASIVLLYQRREKFDAGVFQLLIASIIVTIGAELSFTLYIHAYGLPNMIGHLLKIVSFYLVYKAFIEAGLAKPYALIFRDLKQSEEALRESEERMGLMLEQMRAILWATDSELRFTSSQGAGLAALNLQPDRILGQTLFEYFQTEDPEFLPIAAHRRALEGEPVTYEQTWAGIVYQTHLEPLRDVAGGIVGVIGISLDIIERKRAEEALRESETRYRELFETSRDGIAITDLQGRYVDCNRAYLDLLGYASVDELRLRSHEEVTPREYHEFEARAIEEQTFARGYCDEYEKEYIRKTGERVPVSLHAWLRRSPDNHPVGMWVIVRDITERKRAEEALAEEKEQLGTILSTMKIGLILHNPDRTVAWVNRWIRQMFPHGDPVGQVCYEFFEGTSSPCDPCAVRDCFETGEIHTVESHNQANDRWYSSISHPIKDEASHVTQVLESAMDITERKRVEQALRESEERFRIALKHSPIVVFNQDRELRYTWVYNPDPRVSAETVLGKTDAELFSPEEASRLAEIKRRVLETGVGVREEASTTINEVTFFFDITIEPLHDSAGAVTGITCAAMDITERKRAEEELRLHVALMDNVAEGIYLIGLDDLLIKWTNEKFARMFGYDPKEMVGKQVDMVNAPTERTPAEIRTSIVDVLKETGEWHGEVRNIKRDGTYFWCYANVSLFDHPEYGKVIVSVHTDITERKRAEEALRESEEKWRTLTEYSPDHIMLLDLDYTIRFINHTVPDLTKEQVIGRSNLDFVPPDYHQTAVDCFERVIRSGKPDQYDVMYITTKGESHYFESRISPLLDKGGEVTGLICASNDITERKRAEEALKDSEQELLSTLAATTDGIWKWDFNTDVLFFSPRYYTMLGYEPDEFPATYESWRDLIHPDDLEAALSEAERYLETKPDMYENEFRLRTKTGDYRWIQARGRVIERNEKGVAIRMIGNHEDITERRRAAETLQRSLEETAHSQRLLLSLSQAAQAVQRARTPDEVYRTVGDEVARLGYDATIYTLTEDRAHLAISYMTFKPALLRAAEKLAGLSAQDYRFAIVPGGIHDQIVSEGLTIFRESTVEITAESLPRPLRPLAGRLVALLGGEQAIHAPLMMGGETIGLLAVSGAGLTEADVPAMTAFANQAAIALENTRLLETVTKHTGDLQRLSAQIISAQEAERQRISRELHDEMGQALTAMSINLAAIEKELASEINPVTRERLVETISLADQTLEQVRELALDLRPAMLDDLGLVPAVRWYVNRYAKRLNLEVDLETIDLEERLAPEVETVLYRVVQEALTNVARHAQANSIRLRLERKPSTVVAVIEDDGIGFDVAEPAGQALERGIGLVGTRERVTFLGGSLNIQSRPGQGTRLSIKVPL